VHSYEQCVVQFAILEAKIEASAATKALSRGERRQIAKGRQEIRAKQTNAHAMLSDSGPVAVKAAARAHIMRARLLCLSLYQATPPEMTEIREKLEAYNTIISQADMHAKLVEMEIDNKEQDALHASERKLLSPGGLPAEMSTE
jgi:hypothetical protein